MTDFKSAVKTIGKNAWLEILDYQISYTKNADVNEALVQYEYESEINFTDAATRALQEVSILSQSKQNANVAFILLSLAEFDSHFLASQVRGVRITYSNLTLFSAENKQSTTPYMMKVDIQDVAFCLRDKKKSHGHSTFREFDIIWFIFLGGCIWCLDVVSLKRIASPDFMIHTGNINGVASLSKCCTISRKCQEKKRGY